MIRKITKDIEDEIIETVRKHKLDNVYLFVDAVNEGFENPNIESFLCYQGSEITALIYNYYESLQLLEIGELSSKGAKEIAEYVIKKRIKRISGPTTIIHKIGDNLTGEITDGYIMQYSKSNDINRTDVEKASLEDFEEIASLICNDKHLGSGYSFSNLVKQLKDRAVNQNCKSYVIRKDGVILSHFATYAVAEDIAVLSGMVTRPDYRGQGLGSTLVKSLSSDVKYKDKQKPILYCYEDEYYTWYQKLGYSTVGTSSKLELVY